MNQDIFFAINVFKSIHESDEKIKIKNIYKICKNVLINKFKNKNKSKRIAIYYENAINGQYDISDLYNEISANLNELTKQNIENDVNILLFYVFYVQFIRIYINIEKYNNEELLNELKILKDAFIDLQKKLKTYHNQIKISDKDKNKQIDLCENLLYFFNIMENVAIIEYDSEFELLTEPKSTINNQIKYYDVDKDQRINKISNDDVINYVSFLFQTITKEIQIKLYKK